LLITFYNFEAIGEGTRVTALVREGAELVVMAEIGDEAGVEAEVGPGAEAGTGAIAVAAAPDMISRVDLGSMDLT
jgi:hypothetical protein